MEVQHKLRIKVQSRLKSYVKKVIHNQSNETTNIEVNYNYYINT